MKTIFNRVTRMIALIGVMMVVFTFIPGRSFAAAPHAGSWQHVSALNQHGEFIHHAKFGTVWRPHVVAGWRPFLYGEWIWTDSGWFWDSYEPFGSIVYHYGNWYYDAADGWFWIPGSDWMSAPVRWITFDDYIGWAPLAPAGFFWPDPWDQGFFVWNVVFTRDFHRHDLHKCIIDKHIARPTEVSRVVHNSPNIHRLETVTKTKIEPVHITRTSVKMKERKLVQVQLPKEIQERGQQHRDFVQRQILKPMPKPNVHMTQKHH